MNYTYIIIDDDPISASKTMTIANEFSELNFLATADNYADGVNLILKHLPKLVFLEIDPIDKTSNLSLQLINGLMMYLKELPKIVITTRKKDFAFDSIKYEVIDYLLKPLLVIDFVKLVHKLNKINAEDEVVLLQNASTKVKSKTKNIEPKNSRKSFILCVKSYGDRSRKKQSKWT